MKKYLLNSKKYLGVTQIILGVILLFSLYSNVAAQSSYTKSIAIPEYDATNSEHFLISSSSDWNHINDSDKRFFYVQPNTTLKVVTITADGTESAKRYISLYNGNETHPAKLPVSEQVNVKLIFDAAKHWVIDRMSSINYNGGATSGFCFVLENGSQNIVLNRLFFANFYEGIVIYGYPSPPYNENITIQNSRFDSMSPEGIDGDAVTIKLVANPWNGNGTTKNIFILNNEIRNCNDGIMLQSYSINNPPEVSFEGTVIDYNHIYVDSAVYTDGSGNHDENGVNWAWTENALDIKSGSSDSNKPVIISNNYLWGFKRTDTDGGGSGSRGAAITVHYGTKNVNIENNVIFNSNRALSCSDPDKHTYSIEDSKVSNNIFYNNGFDPVDFPGYTILFFASKNVLFEKNVIVDNNKKTHWFTLNGDEIALKISCNAILDASSKSGSASATTQIEDNTFYNTTAEGSEGVGYSTVAEANMDNLTFATDVYTNNQRNITLVGVQTTATSPHAAECLSPSLGNLPRSSNVIGRWKLDNDATDISGNTQHGTAHNLTYVAGAKAGSDAGVFTGDGDTPSYVEIPNINETTIKTISMWINRAGDAPNGSSDAHVISKDKLYINIKNSGQIKFSAGGASAFVSGLVSDNTWIHIAAVIEPTVIKLYVDGSLADDGGASDLASTNNDFFIGTKFSGGWASFNGKIDDVVFWDVALTSSEVQDAMGSTAPVELTFFTAKGMDETVLLNWSTATEVNNYGFEVERSVNEAEDWETVGFVHGHGNSNSPQEYSFVDSNPLNVSTSYRLKQIDSDGSFEYSNIITVELVLSKEFKLSQNYPNPFNPSTTINYSLPTAGNVKVQIFDVMGRIVAELVNGKQNAGTHNVIWNGRNHHGVKVSSGIYAYRMQYNNQVKTVEMLLLK